MANKRFLSIILQIPSKCRRYTLLNNTFMSNFHYFLVSICFDFSIFYKFHDEIWITLFPIIRIIWLLSRMNEILFVSIVFDNRDFEKLFVPLFGNGTRQAGKLATLRMKIVSTFDSLEKLFISFFYFFFIFRKEEWKCKMSGNDWRNERKVQVISNRLT